MNLSHVIYNLPPVGSTINHLRVKGKHCRRLFSKSSSQIEQKHWLLLAQHCDALIAKKKGKITE